MQTSTAVHAQAAGTIETDSEAQLDSRRATDAKGRTLTVSLHPLRAKCPYPAIFLCPDVVLVFTVVTPTSAMLNKASKTNLTSHYASSVERVKWESNIWLPLTTRGW
jgi:hypothetical protein